MKGESVKFEKNVTGIEMIEGNIAMLPEIPKDESRVQRFVELRKEYSNDFFRRECKFIKVT